jgi:hypothetical protein
MRRYDVIGSVLMLVATSALGSLFAQTPKRVDHRVHADSTSFDLTLPNHPMRAGQTFKAKLQVNVKSGWHVYTHDSTGACCPQPLQIRLPDSFLNDFEIVGLTESGRVTTKFDSNFMGLIHFHTEPFEVIATLKARRRVTNLENFRFYVGYQATNSGGCLFPSWYEVSRRRELVTN